MSTCLGVGKSTLLRHIAMREVPIPPHITILFVEQEVLRYSLLPTIMSTDEEARLLEMTPLRLIQSSKLMYGAIIY